MDAEGYLFCILEWALRGQCKTLKQKEVELCLEGNSCLEQQLKKGSALARMGQRNYLISRSATDAS